MKVKSISMTLTQQWQGETHSVTQLRFMDAAYPRWMTAWAMDVQMYRETGVLLPDREWTAEIVEWD